MFIDNKGTGLLVVAYTDLVVRVCAALKFTAYDEFEFWYVPPDIIKVALQLGMAMEVP